MKALLMSGCLFVASSLAVVAAERTHRLQVEVLPQFAGAPLAFDVATNVTLAGQKLSVTRLDFLLSNIAFRQTNGQWLGLTNWSAYISAREGPTNCELNNIPSGRFDRVRFLVGLPPDINHRDPSNYPPGHPLNPNLNGLHWSWQGGYVFLALEGNWLEASTTRLATSNSQWDHQRGYSFHVATDRQLMTVELPVSISLESDQQLGLVLNVDAIFAHPHAIILSDANASTHSREDDDLAHQLRHNIQAAFTVLEGRGSKTDTPVRQSSNLATSGGTDAARKSPLIIASNATPYPLTVSKSFPRPALPLDNPLTEEGMWLGALLFFDPRLSINRSQSCASCHHSEAAFIDPGRRTSRGAEGQSGTRNTMPLFNLAWKSSFFWDGRAPSLREQVLQPIENPSEMHETLDRVVATLQASRVNPRHRARTRRAITNGANSQPDERPPERFAPEVGNDYPTLFADAFGTREIDADRIARALEQFLLTRVSYGAKFDRVVRGEATLTEDEQRGFELFHTEYDPRRRQFGADCFHCHGGPLFQSQHFANNGLDTEFKDLGRYTVTKKDGDKGKFAVPSLRNVELTGPYMHDGRLATLEEVIEHYTSGVKRTATLDPNLAKHPGGGVPLSEADKKALVAFLKTLTDEHLRATASR